MFKFIVNLLSRIVGSTEVSEEVVHNSDTNIPYNAQYDHMLRSLLIYKSEIDYTGKCLKITYGEHRSGVFRYEVWIEEGNYFGTLFVNKGMRVPKAMYRLPSPKTLNLLRKRVSRIKEVPLEDKVNNFYKL
jgi:hypothetical protein